MFDAVAEHIAAHLPSLEPGAPLFVGDRGGRLPRQTLYKWWSAARGEVKGTDGVTIHDLRHAAGTLAAWTGATQKELMNRLGQSSPRAAIRYQHAAQDRDRELAERLEVIIARARAMPDQNPAEPSA